jgi:hypothetical protein
MKASTLISAFTIIGLLSIKASAKCSNISANSSIQDFNWSNFEGLNYLVVYSSNDTSM